MRDGGKGGSDREYRSERVMFDCMSLMHIQNLRRGSVLRSVMALWDVWHMLPPAQLILIQYFSVAITRCVLRHRCSESEICQPWPRTRMLSQLKDAAMQAVHASLCGMAADLGRAEVFVKDENSFVLPHMLQSSVWLKLARCHTFCWEYVKDCKISAGQRWKRQT